MCASKRKHQRWPITWSISEGLCSLSKWHHLWSACILRTLCIFLTCHRVLIACNGLGVQTIVRRHRALPSLIAISKKNGLLTLYIVRLSPLAFTFVNWPRAWTSPMAFVLYILVIPCLIRPSYITFGLLIMFSRHRIWPSHKGQSMWDIDCTNLLEPTYINKPMFDIGNTYLFCLAHISLAM